MKFLKSTYAAISVAILVFTLSCKEAEDYKHSSGVLLKNATEWFENNSVSRINSTSLNTFFPDWNKGEYIQGIKTYVFPIYRKIDVEYGELGFLRRLVVQFNQDGEVINGGIIELIGSTTKLNNETSNLIESFFTNTQMEKVGFNWFDLNYEFINSSTVKNGINFDGYYRKGMKEANSNSKTNYGCTDWYIVYMNRITGEIVYEEYVFSTCDQCGGGGQCESLDPGSGGNGGHEIEIILIDDPCEVMKRLAQEPTFIAKMNELKNNTSSNFETGYLMQNQGGTITYTLVQGQPNEPQIDINVSSPISGFIHSHYTGTYSTFSSQDVKSIYELYQAGMISDINTFSAGVVTSQGTTYTIIVENLSEFLTFSQENFSSNTTFETFEEFYNNWYTTATTLLGQNEVDARELALLKALEGSGLKLFKGNSTFNQWNSIENQNNQTININCN